PGALRRTAASPSSSPTAAPLAPVNSRTRSTTRRRTSPRSGRPTVAPVVRRRRPGSDLLAPAEPAAWERADGLAPAARGGAAATGADLRSLSPWRPNRPRRSLLTAGLASPGAARPAPFPRWHIGAARRPAPDVAPVASSLPGHIGSHSARWSG